MGELGDLAAARERREQRLSREAEPLLTRQQVARALAVTPRTIDRWAEKGMPIALRLWGGSGAPRYQLSACLDWHASQRR
jgi:phage terminase Nu1 subunit (DNA packaging protein)